MSRGIVGIEIEISRLVGKRKLSQNQDPRDFEGAVQTLKARGQTGLADATRLEPAYEASLKSRNPTRNVKGWTGPCYLITDGHPALAHGPSPSAGSATASAPDVRSRS